jgi:2-C-methyl-D-erythritol 4-phosphate cytidylyltransferase/2-C-methyl-D-erythritol 2,4-cyclodiphosphate synthase
MRVAAVIVAAGRGQRAGGSMPKQFRALGGENALRRSLRLFAAHTSIDVVQAVIDPAHEDAYRASSLDIDKLLQPVHGGATRQHSVRAGLEALDRSAPQVVLIHDAARPLATPALLDRALQVVTEADGAIPTLPVTDTIKRVDGVGRVAETLDRGALRAVQTPQAFAFGKLLAAHRSAAKAGRHDFSDDAALAEWAGLTVTTFPGEPGNLKLTTEEDFARVQALDAASLLDVRTGTGCDVHALGPGDHVVLGGVRIAHDQSLVGHSDADVVLHAITDAVLGAIAAGDIGQHFPPSDPQWRGMSSDRFLGHAVALVEKRNGRIAHIDATVLCEMPKISPHAHVMRANIARICGIEEGRVSVKATTTERLGFLGRGEGIAAMATATVRLPWSG